MVEDYHVRRISDKSISTQSNSQFSQVQIHIKQSHSYEHQDLPRTYWRTNFMLSCLPLIAWGIPTHLIFQRRRIQSTKEWLKFFL